jgi:hypothetical protein
VDVDQAGDDELAARVECRARRSADRRLDGGNAASRDADVANGVEPQRRVDDAAAFDDEVDDEVEAGRLGCKPPHAGQQRGAGRRPHELASIHRRSPRRPVARA